MGDSDESSEVHNADRKAERKDCGREVSDGDRDSTGHSSCIWQGPCQQFVHPPRLCVSLSLKVTMQLIQWKKFQGSTVFSLWYLYCCWILGARFIKKIRSKSKAERVENFAIWPERSMCKVVTKEGMVDEANNIIKKKTSTFCWGKRNGVLKASQDLAGPHFYQAQGCKGTNSFEILWF